jgi:hypothetical protein
MSRQQIRGDRDFDRPPCRDYPANPSLRIQFHAPVSYSAIRGTYRLSIQLEAPAVAWGANGRCWAFLHDFDVASVRLILDDYRQAAYERRGAFCNPFGCRGADQ